MKNLLLVSLFISVSIITRVSAQDTIVGWDFANDTILANYGTEGNLNYRAITACTTNDTAADGFIVREITFTNGISDFAATAEQWDGGANADSTKFWLIKFKAIGYQDLKISSKQRAGGNNGGPKNFKLQYLLKGGEWTDVPSGIVTVANDWTTGEIDQLALPTETNNHNNQSIQIRWIMADNADVNEGDVKSTGIGKIEDIFVTGILITAINSELTNKPRLYPNPCNGSFTLDNPDHIQKVSVFNAIGQLVYQTTQITETLNIKELKQGIYFVQLADFYQNQHTLKLIVR